jgi:hypothetical protein
MEITTRTCKNCGSNHASPSCPRCGLEVVVAKEKQSTRPAERMNKTEARYAQRLEGLKACGEILEYHFEAVKLRLADATFYSPDFMVITADGIEFHEVKGGMIRDDAAVKFKVASEKFPMFGWKMVQWKGGVWTVLRRYASGFSN